MARKREVYGVAEIAEKLGVARQVVAKWKYRGKLPAPDEVLAAGPVWLSASLREFFEEEEK